MKDYSEIQRILTESVGLETLPVGVKFYKKDIY